MVLPRINPDLLLAAQLPVVICWLPLLFLWTLLPIFFSPFYARNLYLPRRFVHPISESGVVFDASFEIEPVLLQFMRSCMSGI
jgi:hypothetical protein